MPDTNLIPVNSVPTRIDFSRNPILYSVIASAPGREIELKVYVESEHFLKDYQLVIVSRKPALADGTVTFKLNGILDALLNRESEAPELTKIQEAKFCRHNILNYFLTWEEIDPVTGLPGALTASSLRTVIRGALPEEVRQSVDFFGTHLTATKQFLTWAPATRKVTLEQPEFLYFLYQGTAELSIKVRWVFVGEVDSEVVEQVIDLSDPYKRKYRLIQVPALEGLNSSHLRAEVVILGTNDAPISETRIFKIEESLAGTDRYFIFENSIGGYDTLRTTGNSEVSLDGKDELAECDPGPDKSKGNYFAYSVNLERKFKQATGFHDREYFQYIQEFLFARRRFVVQKPLGEVLLSARLVPIILKKRSFSFQPEKRLPVGYTFEYDYAFDTIAYANL